MIIAAAEPAPADTPVTMPEVPTVAIAELLLLHAPVAGRLLNVVVWPTHIVSAPLMVPGNRFTVIVLEVAHPVLNVYTILVVPAAIPATIPEPAPTVPAAVMLLLHVPPSGVLVSVIVDCSHTTDGPPIADGSGFTSTTAVREHPPTPIHIMVTVPALIPVTTPVADIVATAGLLLLQVTPGVVVLRTVVPPAHKFMVPVIGAGSGLTVSIVVAMQPLGASV